MAMWGLWRRVTRPRRWGRSLSRSRGDLRANWSSCSGLFRDVCVYTYIYIYNRRILETCVDCVQRCCFLQAFPRNTQSPQLFGALGLLALSLPLPSWYRLKQVTLKSCKGEQQVIYMKRNSVYSTQWNSWTLVAKWSTPTRLTFKSKHVLNMLKPASKSDRLAPWRKFDALHGRIFLNANACHV